VRHQSIEQTFPICPSHTKVNSQQGKESRAFSLAFLPPLKQRLGFDARLSTRLSPLGFLCFIGSTLFLYNGNDNRSVATISRVDLLYQSFGQCLTAYYLFWLDQIVARKLPVGTPTQAVNEQVPYEATKKQDGNRPIEMQAITAMLDYEHVSFEELRWDHSNSHNSRNINSGVYLYNARSVDRGVTVIRELQVCLSKVTNADFQQTVLHRIEKHHSYLMDIQSNITASDATIVLETIVDLCERLKQPRFPKIPEFVRDGGLSSGPQLPERARQDAAQTWLGRILLPPCTVTMCKMLGLSWCS